VGWTMDGIRIPDGAVVEVDPGQGYDLGVEFAADAVEDYVWMESTGDLREGTEEPYVTWYATAGSIEDYWSIWPSTEGLWIAPVERDVSGTWWAVVRDRRGGISWRAQAFHVRSVPVPD
jgi:hypothetical protein